MRLWYNNDLSLFLINKQNLNKKIKAAILIQKWWSNNKHKIYKKKVRFQDIESDSDSEFENELAFINYNDFIVSFFKNMLGFFYKLFY